MNQKLKVFFLWILVGLLSLGQFQRIELAGSFAGVNFYLHEVLILLWVVHYIFTNFTFFTKQFQLLTKKQTYQRFLKKYPFESVFIFILLLSVSFNLILNQDFVSLLYIARFATYILFGTTLKHSISRKYFTGSMLKFMFYGSGLIILFLGILQLLFVKDTRFLAILGWDDHYNRLISTIFDPAFTGIILLISLLYSFSLAKLREKVWQKIEYKALFLVSLLSFFIGIAMTFSRATYLALVVSFVSLKIFDIVSQTKKPIFSVKSLVVLMLGFLTIVVFIPKPGGEGVDLTRTASVSGRTDAITNQTQSISAQTILIGNGLFSIKNSISDFQTYDKVSEVIPSHSRIPDNSILNIFLSTGIFGLFTFAVIFIKWLVKIIKKDPIMASVLLAVLIHSQFSNTIFHPFVFLFVLIGLVSVKKSKA